MTLSRLASVIGVLICAALAAPASAAVTVSCSGVDDTAAIQAALNSSDDVVIPGGLCVASNLTLVANPGRLSGIGPASVIVQKAGASGALITAAGVATLRDFKLRGGSYGDKRFDALLAPVNSRSGIAIAPDLDSRIDGVTVEGFDEHCIRFTPSGVSSIYVESHLIISNVKVSNCHYGLRIGDEGLGEYIVVNGLDAGKNAIALTVSTGNITVGNAKIADNGIGVDLVGTGFGNNGHGNISNSLINHSVLWAVRATDITVGFNLIGNQVHLGSILLKNSHGIGIANSQLQVAEMRFDGGGVNIVHDNRVLINPPYGTDTVIHDDNGHCDKTIVERNLTMTGKFKDSVGCGLVDWSLYNSPNWSSFNPVLGCSSGTLAAASALGQYRREGSKVYLEYVITIASPGGIGSCAGSLVVPLPPGVSVPRWYVLPGKDIGAGAREISAFAIGSNLSITDYQNGMPLSGSTLVLSGVIDAN